jgi:hypothetical protein
MCIVRVATSTPSTPGEEAITAFTYDGVDKDTEFVKMIEADPDRLRRFRSRK